MITFDEIYAKAAIKTGKSEAELRKMAEQVFASMLWNAMERQGITIMTAARIGDDDRLDVEVNYIRRSAF